MKNGKLQSENVIIESPMSFTGATKRIWPLLGRSDNKYVKWLVLFPTILITLYIVYVIILCWYCVFGIFLIPFRVMRRGQRRKKQQELQHRELMQALANKK